MKDKIEFTRHSPEVKITEKEFRKLALELDEAGQGFGPYAATPAGWKIFDDAMKRLVKKFCDKDE